MQILLVAAAVAQTFNLSCAGTMETIDFNSGIRTAPYSTIYRINLDTKQWCEGECQALYDIAEAAPGYLALSRQDVDGVTETKTVSNTIDRQTGRHINYYSTADPRQRLSRYTMSAKGQCERQPFTGFPALETKF